LRLGRPHDSSVHPSLVTRNRLPPQLIGLKRVLTWTDFGTPARKPAPKPGGTAPAAFTYAQYAAKGIGAEAIPGSKPVRYRLKDAVTVTIEFVKTKSWVADWVFKEPTSFQNDLLAHEQGHYLVATFMGRDLFIDLMQLKTSEYAAPGQLTTAVNAVNARYSGKSNLIHRRYDVETRSGLDPVKQARGDGFFTQAFTTARSPAQTAPDGTPYKLRLLDVLKAGGITL